MILVVRARASAAAATGSSSSRPPAEQPEPGEVVTLEPIQINLAGGHYLRIGLALQLTADAHEADGSKALDATIELFSGADHGRADQARAARGAEAASSRRSSEDVPRRRDGGVLHRVRHPVAPTGDPVTTRRDADPLRSDAATADTAAVTPCCLRADLRPATPGHAVAPARRRAGALRLPAADPALPRALADRCSSALDGFARQATTVFTSSLRTVCAVQLARHRAAELRRVRRLAATPRRT